MEYKKLGKIFPEEEKYYVVTYDRRPYIGRVLKVGKTGVAIKFLERRMNNQYYWLEHDDIDEAKMIHLISGPVVLSGTLPCTVTGINKAFVDLKCM